MGINSAADRMNILMNRLLEQKVVPFLGAGVSCNAIHQDGTKELCKTDKMCCNIEKAIDELIASKDYDTSELGTWYTKHEQYVISWCQAPPCFIGKYNLISHDNLVENCNSGLGYAIVRSFDAIMRIGEAQLLLSTQTLNFPHPLIKMSTMLP